MFILRCHWRSFESTLNFLSTTVLKVLDPFQDKIPKIWSSLMSSVVLLPDLNDVLGFIAGSHKLCLFLNGNAKNTRQFGDYALLKFSWRSQVLMKRFKEFEWSVIPCKNLSFFKNIYMTFCCLKNASGTFGTLCVSYLLCFALKLGRARPNDLSHRYKCGK